MAVIYFLLYFKGMVYLHASRLHSHGNLKSGHCLVDGRWVLKITAYGLRAFQNDSRHREVSEYQEYYNLLWTAPELLRMGDERPVYGSQKGDVYSFAIILQEILYRALPYFIGELTPRGILLIAIC